MAEKEKELWRTMNEPDIDPLMVEAIRLNVHFRDWWVQAVKPDLSVRGISHIKANFTREEESAVYQSKPRRETDQHPVVEDLNGSRHAILTESKIVAPASDQQQEDYAGYVQWGVETERWKTGTTVIMAPGKYLGRRSAADYDRKISYEEISKQAKCLGLYELAEHLNAGVIRHRKACEPRNPDEVIGAFRNSYGDLLREEHPKLYESLSGKDKCQFDKSQKWFYFKFSDKFEIVHKVSNKRTKEQDETDQQYLSLHVFGADKHISRMQDLSFCCQRPEINDKGTAIYKIPLDEDDWMFFKSFDAEAARRVWKLTAELLKQWRESGQETKIEGR